MEEREEGMEIFERLVEREGGVNCLIKNCLKNGVRLYTNNRSLAYYDGDNEETLVRIWYLELIYLSPEPERAITIWDIYEIGLTLLEASLGKVSMVDEGVSQIEVVTHTRNTFSVKFSYQEINYEFSLVTQETEETYAPFIILSLQKE